MVEGLLGELYIFFYDIMNDGSSKKQSVSRKIEVYFHERFANYVYPKLSK